MYVILALLILAIPTFNVYTSSLLSETNTNVERLKSKIAKQENTNQSLNMQVDELILNLLQKFMVYLIIMVTLKS